MAEMPRISDGYLGPQAKFHPYGLQTLSHPDAQIDSDSNKIIIVIGMPKKARFTSKLLSCNPKGECNERVFTQMPEGGQEVQFLLALPHVGYYKFQIYCLPSDEAGPNMINVYNYLINVKQIDNFVEPFPKQYPIWKQEGCYIYEPFMLMSGINTQVKFKFYIPRAVDVQVKVADDWKQLDKIDTNVYEGIVDFSPGYPSGTKARLNVKFGRSSKYDILLEYTI